MNPVQTFLRNHYSDGQLVTLLDDCRNESFRFQSCCCFVGRVTEHDDLCQHLEAARLLPGACEAEEYLNEEFFYNASRRAFLIPICEAEIAYRGARNVESNSSLCPDMADVCSLAGVAVSGQEA